MGIAGLKMERKLQRPKNQQNRLRGAKEGIKGGEREISSPPAKGPGGVIVLAQKVGVPTSQLKVITANAHISSTPQCLLLQRSSSWTRSKKTVYDSMAPHSADFQNFHPKGHP